MNRLISVAALLAACSGKSSETKPVETNEKRDAATGSDRPLPMDDASAAVALPPAAPVPTVPAGLPPLPEGATAPTPEAVALGELLFYETRLSHTNKLACATCHPAEHGFSGDRTDTASAKPNLRRSPPLVNLAWHKELAWDGRYASLADQLAAHARGQLGNDLGVAVARISEVPGYRAHFQRVGGAMSADAATAALAAYVATRYAGSPWDAIERAGNVSADLDAGVKLFNGKAQCAVCHTPPLYTDLRYHRLGLIKTPDEGRGKMEPAQKGAFKTPTLRAAGLRTTFFHDGSAATLDAAIDWHLAGGTGQGADPSIVDVKRVTLTPKEREQLGAFVRALTSTDVAQVRPSLP